MARDFGAEMGRWRCRCCLPFRLIVVHLVDIAEVLLTVAVAAPPAAAHHPQAPTPRLLPTNGGEAFNRLLLHALLPRMEEV